MSTDQIAKGFQFSPGDTLEGFRLEEVIGSGGMGLAWRATQLALDRTVCVKFIHPDHRVHPGYLRLLKAEAKTLATLEHPNILTIHHLGQAEGHFFIVTEYIGGLSLQQLIANWILLPGEKVELIRAVGSAIQYVHDRGVLHRDIKPSNILLSESGRIKVADFGLSKMLAAPGDMTSTGHLGTESYAAPEILLGRTYDHRADQFSLAVTFYRLLAGYFPPIPGTVNSNNPLPPELEAIFERALSIEAEHRYPSTSAFCLHLIGALSPGQPVLATLEHSQFPIRKGLTVDTPSAANPHLADPRDAPTAAPIATREPSGMIKLEESWMPIPKAMDPQRQSGTVKVPNLSTPEPPVEPTATPEPPPVTTRPFPLPPPRPAAAPPPPRPQPVAAQPAPVNPPPRSVTVTLPFMGTVVAFILGVLLTIIAVQCAGTKGSFPPPQPPEAAAKP